MRYNVAMVFQIVVWWYGEGWRRVSRAIFGGLKEIEQTFSVSQLARSMFAPWRRITSYGGRTIDEKVRAAIDNLVSRVVGFFTRLIVLMAALLAMVLVVCFGSLVAIVWPLIPLAVPYCIVRGIIG